MKRFKVSGAACLFLVLAAACSPDHLEGPSQPGPITSGPSFTVIQTPTWSRKCTATSYTPGSYHFYRLWSCQQQIVIASSAMQTVVDEWNSALHAVELELPHLATSGLGPSVTYSNTCTATNADCEGQVTPALGALPTNLSIVPKHTQSGYGKLLPIQYVESSHVWGFDDNWEVLGKESAPYENCFTASSLVYTHTALCQPMIEQIYYAYGLRDHSPDGTNKYIITGMLGLSTTTVSVPIGQTYHAVVTGLLYGRSGCPETTCPGTPGSAVLAWISDSDHTTLQSTANNAVDVQAVSLGVDTIRVVPAAADTNEWTAVLGRSWAPNRLIIQVVAAPPPPTMPDLRPRITAISPSARIGGPFSVFLQADNIGTASAPAGWTGKLYLSTDQVLSGNDVQVSTFTMASAIAAGGSAPVSRYETVPVSVATGSYYVLAAVDVTNVVTEVSETNNGAVSAGLMTVLPPLPLGVTINYGPSLVKSNVGCEWRAQATQGVKPYTWSWNVGTATTLNDSTSAVNYTNTGSSFTLIATVTDALGTAVQATLPVVVKIGGPVCPL